MPTDTAPDVREVIARAIYEATPENQRPFRTYYDLIGHVNQDIGPESLDVTRQADAVLTALAGLADERFAAAVQEYGQAKLQLGGAGIDDYHKGLVGTVYSQAEPLKAPAEEKERILLALHAAATHPKPLNLTLPIPAEREVRARILLAIDPELNRDGAYKVVDRVIAELERLGALNMAALGGEVAE